MTQLNKKKLHLASYLTFYTCLKRLPMEVLFFIDYKTTTYKYTRKVHRITLLFFYGINTALDTCSHETAMSVKKKKQLLPLICPRRTE